MKRFLIATGIVLAALALLAAAGVAYIHHIFNHRAEGAAFDSAGVPIHYSDQGTGVPVILLHGFAINGDLNWRRPGIVDALAKEYRVIVPDLRGHGLSGKPHDPAAYGSQMAEDVIRLMDFLHLEKAHLAGYSLGGFIALKLAVLHPDRFHTITAAGAGWEEKANYPVLNRIRVICEQIAGNCAPDDDKTTAGLPSPRFGFATIIRLVARHLNDPEALRAAIESAPDLRISEAELRAIAVPVCSIAGENDILLPCVENMRGKIWDHAITIVKGANHLQTPGRSEFLQALLAFLHEHPEGKTAHQ